MLNVAIRIVLLPRGGGACVALPPKRAGIEKSFQSRSPLSANQPIATAAMTTISEDIRFMRPSVDKSSARSAANQRILPGEYRTRSDRIQGNSDWLLPKTCNGGYTANAESHVSLVH